MGLPSVLNPATSPVVNIKNQRLFAIVEQLMTGFNLKCDFLASNCNCWLFTSDFVRYNCFRVNTAAMSESVPLKKFVTETELDEKRKKRQEEWEKVRQPHQPIGISQCYIDV
jgi:hypothetical protein